MLKNFALVVAAAGGLALATFAPAPSQAAGVFLNRDLGSAVESPVQEVRCWHRRGWSRWRCHRRWESRWW